MTSEQTRSRVATQSNVSASQVHEREKQAHALAAENRAKSSVRQNLSYLFNPSTSTGPPARLRTRALLRVLHSVGVFLYWKAVRWAKYAIVGAVVGAIGSFAVAGSLASGVGFLVAPPGILASIAVGGVWYTAKFAWRRIQRRRNKTGHTSEVPTEGQVHPRFVNKEPELVPW